MRRALVLLARIGVAELIFVCALGAITAGLWPVIGQAALVVPGAVLVWLTLPTRLPFVNRPARRRD